MGLRARCPIIASLMGHIAGCLRRQQSWRLHCCLWLSLLCSGLAMPCLFVCSLLYGLHAVHHCVMLHWQTLLEGIGGVPLSACQPRYGLAVPAVPEACRSPLDPLLSGSEHSGMQQGCLLGVGRKQAIKRSTHARPGMHMQQCSIVQSASACVHGTTPSLPCCPLFFQHWMRLHVTKQ